MATNVTQVRANIPRRLKRLAFSQLALQELTFSTWVRERLEEWLCSIEQPDSYPDFADEDAHDERLA